jgi:hypothetical protein
MGFDAAVAEAALRMFGGNVQLAAQTLVHHGGSLPPDLQLSGDSSSSTPSPSPSDSAGRSAKSLPTHQANLETEKGIPALRLVQDRGSQRATDCAVVLRVTLLE